MSVHDFTLKSCKRDRFSDMSDLIVATIMMDAVACFIDLQVNPGTLALRGPETGDVHSTVNNMFDAVEFCLESLMVFSYMFGMFKDQTTCLP